MVRRIAAIAFNTYREAVRARILHGLFAMALATAGYALVVGAFAIRDTLRAVSDLGAASISLYAILVAIILGATSLYRELELKTAFPILARPLRRTEYLVGKYLGTLLTLGVFVAANAGALLLALGVVGGRRLIPVAALGLGSVAVAGVIAWRVPRWRTPMPLFWAIAVAIIGYRVASIVPDDQRVITGSAVLTLAEVGIVAAAATVFASFSSPFLSSVLTLGVFLIGRSADTLANLPSKVFGEAIHAGAGWLARIVPNLMLYVPPRPLLTGTQAGLELGPYLLGAALHALGWSALLLAIASVIFRRRDFL